IADVRPQQHRPAGRAGPGLPPRSARHRAAHQGARLQLHQPSGRHLMTIITRALRRLPTAALTVLGITATTSAAGAQANFDWPAADTTFSSYTSPEQCVVAVRRVADVLAWETRSDT